MWSTLLYYNTILQPFKTILITYFYLLLLLKVMFNYLLWIINSKQKARLQTYCLINPPPIWTWFKWNCIGLFFEINWKVGCWCTYVICILRTVINESSLSPLLFFYYHICVGTGFLSQKYLCNIDYTLTTISTTL